MLTETRRRLVLAWGMCQRHSLAALSVEAAYRHGYLHGPAILYSDLMARAARALEATRGRRLARRLRARAPCLMCDLGYGPRSEGFIAPRMLATGRDPFRLRGFLSASQLHWSQAVCGVCAGSSAAARCRVHLCEALEDDGAIDLEAQRALVARVAQHVQHFSRSFGWDERGTDTPADRAALVSAAGWCCGWDALLDFGRGKAVLVKKDA